MKGSENGDRSFSIPQQSNHIIEDPWVRVARSIYTSLFTGKNCIEIDKERRKSKAKLSGSQRQMLMSMYRRLSSEDVGFFSASRCPPSKVQKGLAREYEVSTPIWRYKYYPSRRLLRQKLPKFFCYWVEILPLTVSMIELFNVAPHCRETCSEYLGDSVQYRTAGLENGDDVDQYPQSNLTAALSNDREVRIFEIPCQLAGHSTNALGDYGAKDNFMNEEYALDLGLPISRNAAYKVTIGSGKQVTTVGTATVLFQFSGESEVHNLEFQLLPNCIHDVIIGKPFLKLTKTFSNVANFYRRVKERIAKGISQFHLLYLGASTPMFEGSINGRVQTTALADSGSKVLLMDEAYARSIGVHIETGHEHQTRLKFADNSVTDTAGMAYDVNWRFGCDGQFTSPYPLNFHILKNAPANVVLSDTFLFDTNAFSQYHHYLIDDYGDYEDEDMLIYLFAIDIDKRKNRTQVNVTSFSLADLRYLELVRRGEEADRISTIPGPEGTAAQSIEDERCAEWDRAFTALQANDQPQNLQPLFAAVAAVQSTTSSHSSTSRLQGSRPSRAHRSFSKFLTWLRHESSAGRDGGAVAQR